MTAMVLLSEWMKSQVEFWKPIEGFEGYDVSSFGRVRSWRYRNGYPSSSFRFLPSRVRRTGYLDISVTRTGVVPSLRHGDTGTKGTRRLRSMVHRLVAQAFLVNVNNLPEVNHRNGIKGDNRLDNLEWVSRRANIGHAFRVGLFRSRAGEANSQAKLSEDDVRTIYTRMRLGENGAAVARDYGLTRTATNDIFNRKTWNHLNLGES